MAGQLSIVGKDGGWRRRWWRLSPAVAAVGRAWPWEGFVPGQASPMPGRLERAASEFTADPQGKSGREGIKW